MTTENRNSVLLSEKRVYTVAEAAAILAVSNNTMYKLVKMENFSVRKVGREIRISKPSFDEWLDKQVQH